MKNTNPTPAERSTNDPATVARMSGHSPGNLYVVPICMKWEVREACEYGSHPVTLHVDEGMAHLIAAAPAMERAIALTLGWADVAGDVFDGEGEDEDSREIRSILRAALALARKKAE